jgi:hypothetical protein
MQHSYFYRLKLSKIWTLHFQDRVVNGNDANDLQYPWQVGFFYYIVDYYGPGKPTLTDKFFCGGTLLSENKILTAAHCFPNGKHYKKFKTYHGKSDTLGFLFASIADLGSNGYDGTEEWIQVTFFLDFFNRFSCLHPR